MRLTKDRRNFENDDVGIVSDTTGSFVKKMSPSTYRKFWVIVDCSNTRYVLKLLTEDELRCVEQVNNLIIVGKFFVLFIKM